VTTSRCRTRILTAATALLTLAALGGCSRVDRGTGAEQATDKGPAAEVRLGYFPNVTHAAALIGLEKGLFDKELGNTKLVPTTFNDGPTEVGALLGGSLDIGFIGSGPAINAYAKSNGEAVRLIAGATLGGAQLVVKSDITRPEDLAGKTVVTPALGNTQDVSLKRWLSERGSDRQGRGHQPGERPDARRLQGRSGAGGLAARAVVLAAGARRRRHGAA
jgi:NitT/TauT family transport system substrate-binding protein